VCTVWIDPVRVDQLRHAGVEVVGRQCFLLGGVGNEPGISEQFPIRERAQSVAACIGSRGPALPGAPHQRPKRFEAGTSAGVLTRKQESALPEALSADGRVRLGVDREQESAVFRRLRHPLHDHECVSVGICVDRTGSECVQLEWHRIEVSGVVIESGACIARLNHVDDSLRQCLEAFERIVPRHPSSLVAGGPQRGARLELPRLHVRNPKGKPSFQAKYARKKYGRSAQSGVARSALGPASSSPRPR